MGEAIEDEQWLLLSSSDLLTTSRPTGQPSWNKQTIFGNISGGVRTNLDSNDLLNIFGDYDSHAFPSAAEVQVV